MVLLIEFDCVKIFLCYSSKTLRELQEIPCHFPLMKAEVLAETLDSTFTKTFTNIFIILNQSNILSYFQSCSNFITCKSMNGYMIIISLSYKTHVEINT